MTRSQPHADASADKDEAVMLPVANATVPYWRSELHELDEFRSTKDLPSECDIAIIGAGMSGVAMAYHLLKVSADSVKPSIVLLDARQVCSGATGRNGGHVKIKTTSMTSLKEKFGLEIAEEVFAFVDEQIDALKHVVESEGIDCEFELRRSFDLFLDEEDAQKAERGFSKSVDAGEKWTRSIDLIPKDRAEQVTSIRGAKGALSRPICSLWPYKFVTQLLATFIDDINLQTNTPVTQVIDDGASGLQILRTPRGILKAKQVVFSSNGYTGGICPRYKDKIVPYRGTASHLTPRAGPVSPHLSHTYNINYTPDRVDYLNPRPSPDGGIVVGGGKWTYEDQHQLWYNNWDDSTLLPQARSHFDSLMQRYFMGWERSGSTVDFLWTGIMALTADEFPHVGHVPGKEGRQYIIAGFNGGGNAMIFLSALGLAKMIRQGVSFKQTGLPRVFEASAERLVENPSLEFTGKAAR